MTILSPSQLETTTYGTSGWNAINNSNWQKINTIWSRIERIEYPASQEDATFDSLDAIRNKLFFNYLPIIELAEGDNTIDLSDVVTAFTLRGDTRVLAGHTWIHGKAVLSSKSGAGVGVVTLSKSSNDITIACATTNPDFTNWGNGDIVIICDTSGNIAKYTIDSISGNIITLTTAVPTVAGEGATITLIPNRRITSEQIFDVKVALQGLFFDGISESVAMTNQAEVSIENCVFFDTVTCWQNDYASFLECVGYENSILKCTNGVSILYGAKVNVSGLVIVGATDKAYLAKFCSTMYARKASAIFCAYGFVAWQCSSMQCQEAYVSKITYDGYLVEGAGSIEAVSATARYCNVGYKANSCSNMHAQDVSANSVGNGTNYSWGTYSSGLYS